MNTPPEPPTTPPPPPPRLTEPVLGATAPPAGAHWTLVILMLAGVCLVIRMAHLLSLPIFGDEAIYLRWAQLIRGDSLGLQHGWVSLADPKPPLHFWILALVFHWSQDPLAAGRMISALAGAVSIPLLFSLGRELEWLIRYSRVLRPTPGFKVAQAEHSGSVISTVPVISTHAPSGRVLGLLASLFMIVCPFFAFYQRLATADSFFVCESLTVVWLSLRWSRQAAGGLKGAWRSAILLGVSIGIALLTRQGISYTLCAMPVIGWLLRPTFRWRVIGWSVLQFFLAGAIAFVIWSPYLLAELAPRAAELADEEPRNVMVGRQFSPEEMTTRDLLLEMRRRIFYQDRFTDIRISRAELMLRNARAIFLPAYDRDGNPISGWLYFYLTPPLYLLGMVGLSALIPRGQWRLLLLLVLWLILTLGPVIALGNMIYSRYILAGVPPLLFAAAFVFADGVQWLFRSLERRPALAWAGTVAALIALCALPIQQLLLQSTRWWRQTLTRKNIDLPDPGDYYQYVSGWTAGYATARVISEVRNLAREGPLVVITGNEWGTPADALWVYLSEMPNVRIFYTDQGAIGGKPAPSSPGAPLETAEQGPDPNRLWLRPDKWLWPRYIPVSVPANVPVLYITKTLWDGAPSADRLKPENPNLELWETFKGIENNGERDPDGAVNIFKLNRPGAR